MRVFGSTRVSKIATGKLLHVPTLGACEGSGALGTTDSAAAATAGTGFDSGLGSGVSSSNSVSSSSPTSLVSSLDSEIGWREGGVSCSGTLGTGVGESDSTMGGSASTGAVLSSEPSS